MFHICIYLLNANKQQIAGRDNARISSNRFNQSNSCFFLNLDVGYFLFIETLERTVGNESKIKYNRPKEFLFARKKQLKTITKLN